MGLLAASAGATAGSADAAGGVPAQPQADLQSDVRVLETLLHGERVLQYAYGRAFQVWRFKPATVNLLRLMLAHEREHEKWLEGQIASLGGGGSAAGRSGGPFPPPAVSALFENINGQRTVTALIKVEELIQGSYFHAVRELKSPELARSLAQILACEAQHSMMLTDVLDHGDLPELVPLAFVRGIGDLSS
jgi:hypothetical protein